MITIIAIIIAFIVGCIVGFLACSATAVSKLSKQAISLADSLGEKL